MSNLRWVAKKKTKTKTKLTNKKTKTKTTKNKTTTYKQTNKRDLAKCRIRDATFLSLETWSYSILVVLASLGSMRLFSAAFIVNEGREYTF
jgi:hypothetical protein